ncbi:MAG: hypothetical protein ABSC95_28285 [Acetobacteraceae bacterium]
MTKERAIYTSILILTDGSELARKAVQHGISAILLGSETAKVLTHATIPGLVYR